MIIMDIKLDNLCSFRDFHINMSYPKKIVNTTIENEFLPNYTNFRYKKVNIIMGTNASGKTSFGKVLMSIFGFIYRKEIMRISDRIADIKKETRFSIDFIPDGKRLFRLDVVIPPEGKNEYLLEKCNISLRKENILSGDSYEKCLKRLMNSTEFKGVDALSEIPQFGWYFTYPVDSHYAIHDRSSDLEIGDLENELYLKVLKNILMTLDNSILDITNIDEIENTYAIITCNKKLVIQDGAIIDNNNILSSGTKAGIDVADLLTALIEHRNGFYYCDEKFSYIHSDIEKTILSVMISKLGDGEQLFFTSHNLDIADMDLPKHSFLFMRKNNIDNETFITCESASDKLKKPTESIRSAIDNDLFGIAPKVELLHELES